MNQCEKLLDYMKSHGSVTGMESIDMGVMNYKGRINDLRKLGFAIETRMETNLYVTITASVAEGNWIGRRWSSVRRTCNAFARVRET